MFSKNHWTRFFGFCFAVMHELHVVCSFELSPSECWLCFVLLPLFIFQPPVDHVLNLPLQKLEYVALLRVCASFAEAKVPSERDDLS